MNLFTLQGRLLYIEPPKEEGKSAQMMFAVGEQKNTTESIVQIVNKVIVRVPSYVLAKHPISDLVIDDFYEIYGHINPLTKRDPSREEKFLLTDLVVAGFHRTSPVGDMKKAEIERSLFSRWASTGIIRDYRKSKKSAFPDLLVVQIRDEVKNKEELTVFGGSEVMINVGKHLKERLIGLEVGHAVYLEGRIAGFLRRIPSLIPGEYEQTLHNTVALSHIHRIGVVGDWHEDILSEEEI